MLSFLLAFGHFASEIFIYKTADIAFGSVAPLVVSGNILSPYSATVAPEYNTPSYSLSPRCFYAADVIRMARRLNKTEEKLAIE